MILFFDFDRVCMLLFHPFLQKRRHVKKKSALIVLCFFWVVATQIIASRLVLAKEQSLTTTAPIRHHWILWEIIQDPRNPIAYAEGAYLTKKRCMGGIMGDVPDKTIHSCLPIGVTPLYIPLSRHERYKASPFRPSSPSGSKRD